MRRTISTALTLLLTATTLATTGTAVEAGDTCTSDSYPTAAAAKAGFANDCGQPFRNTPEYRCDWASAGWHCSGPGSRQDSGSSGDSGNSGGSSSAQGPITPTIIQAEHNGRFNSVVWKNLPTMKGVNVYRNGSYVASVNMPGNVYNDYRGKSGDDYYLVAYNDADKFSSKSRRVTAGTAAPQSMSNVQARHAGNGRVDITWNKGAGQIDGWQIYRNGRYVGAISATGKRDYRDTRSGTEKISYYEIRAFVRDHNGRVVAGPKAFVPSPILSGLANNPGFQPRSARSGKGQLTQRAEEVRRTNDEADDAWDDAVSASIDFGGASADYVAGDGGIGSVLATGAHAWREIGQYQDARDAADDAVDRYNRCASSPSCRGDDDGDDTPGPNIPGTNTPGGCNEGGCWPA